MRRLHVLGVAAGCAALLSAGTALAQAAGDYVPAEDGARVPVEPEPVEPPPPPPPAAQHTEPPPMAQAPAEAAPETYAVQTRYGVRLTLGGGLIGFVDDDTTDFTDVGGAWEARVAVGTRTPLAFEGAYIGSAQDVNAIGLASGAALLGNGAEAAARVNFSTGGLQPYAFGGIGWRHYRIVNADFNTSNLADRDNVLEVPAGAGVSYSANGIVVDLRGTYRLAFDDTLIDGNQDLEAGLDNWSATLRAGFDF